MNGAAVTAEASCEADSRRSLGTPYNPCGEVVRIHLCRQARWEVVRMEGTKIARLWKQTDKKGKVYFAGPMSQITRLVIIANDRKKDAKDPDYYAYVVPNRGHLPLSVDDDEE